MVAKWTGAPVWTGTLRSRYACGRMSDPLVALVEKVDRLEGQLEAAEILLGAAVEAIVQGELTRSGGDTVARAFEKALQDALARLETSDAAHGRPDYIRGFTATVRSQLQELGRRRRRS